MKMLYAIVGVLYVTLQVSFAQNDSPNEQVWSVAELVAHQEALKVSLSRIQKLQERVISKAQKVVAEEEHLREQTSVTQDTSSDTLDDLKKKDQENPAIQSELDIVKRLNADVESRAKMNPSIAKLFYKHMATDLKWQELRGELSRLPKQVYIAEQRVSEMMSNGEVAKQRSGELKEMVRSYKEAIEDVGNRIARLRNPKSVTNAAYTKRLEDVVLALRNKHKSTSQLTKYVDELMSKLPVIKKSILTARYVSIQNKENAKGLLEFGNITKQDLKNCKIKQADGKADVAKLSHTPEYMRDNLTNLFIQGRGLDVQIHREDNQFNNARLEMRGDWVNVTGQTKLKVYLRELNRVDKFEVSRYVEIMKMLKAALDMAEISFSKLEKKPLGKSGTHKKRKHHRPQLEEMADDDNEGTSKVHWFLSDIDNTLDSDDLTAKNIFKYLTHTDTSGDDSSGAPDLSQDLS